MLLFVIDSTVVLTLVLAFSQCIFNDLCMMFSSLIFNASAILLSDRSVPVSTCTSRRFCVLAFIWRKTLRGFLADVRTTFTGAFMMLMIENMWMAVFLMFVHRTHLKCWSALSQCSRCCMFTATLLQCKDGQNRFFKGVWGFLNTLQLVRLWDQIMLVSVSIINIPL